MTTSYKLQAVKELKAQKKLDRIRQANEERIAKKMARIEKGVIDEPTENTKKVEKKKPTPKKTAVKKSTAKKRGRPKKKS